VGIAGNTAADTRVMNDGSSGYGQVDYAYGFGRYEATAAQYTAFLNAIATTDAYGLYNTAMATDAAGCQIIRSGTSGSYT
jgi:formylglycine-generating enzyme